jgi:hypothetical protein
VRSVVVAAAAAQMASVRWLRAWQERGRACWC